MSREKAWQKAMTAETSAVDRYYEAAGGGLFTKPDPNRDVYLLLALIAGAIKELTMPDGPLRITECKIGQEERWWD